MKGKAGEVGVIKKGNVLYNGDRVRVTRPVFSV